MMIALKLGEVGTHEVGYQATYTEDKALCK